MKGLHVGIIMDGNGRWALERGLPRVDGHRAGVRAVERVIAAAPDLGIGTLTLFAFSCDNWLRPVNEVSELMRILERFLRRRARPLAERGVRLRVIGRRDRVPRQLARAIERAESIHVGHPRLVVRLAIDYSGRDAILRAADRFEELAERGPDAFARFVASGGRDEVDLVVRTGGERRLSDFLLWESAYAELLFVERPWPDFDGDALRDAVDDFRRRERRFGRLSDADVPAGSRSAPARHSLD